MIIICSACFRCFFTAIAATAILVKISLPGSLSQDLQQLLSRWETPCSQCSILSATMLPPVKKWTVSESWLKRQLLQVSSWYSCKYCSPKFTMVEHHNLASRIFFGRTKSYWMRVLWKSINHDDNPCDFDCCCLLTHQLCIRLQQGRPGRHKVDNWLCISRAILIQTDSLRLSARHKDNESSTIIQTLYGHSKAKAKPKDKKSHISWLLPVWRMSSLP